MTHNPLTPRGTKLFQLSSRIARFSDENTEWLNFGEYADLCEQETKLLAYGNLLETSDQEGFLEAEISEAEQRLADITERVQAKAAKGANS